MRFAKVHGLGNDFLFAAPGGGPSPAEAGALARRLCDRHTGVGADGLILLSPEKNEPGAAGFRIFNADGSEAEISGNGLRCAAAYLAWSGAVKSPKVLFRTAAGERPSEILSARGSLFEVRIGLGAPRLAARDIPFDDGRDPDRLLDYPLAAAGRTFFVTCVSMGNPHCSLFFDALPPREEWPVIGAAIESHPVLPAPDERRVRPRPRPGGDRSPLLGARRRRDPGFRDRVGGRRRRRHAQGPREQVRHSPHSHRQSEGRVARGRSGAPDGPGRGRFFRRLSGGMSGGRRSRHLEKCSNPPARSALFLLPGPTRRTLRPAMTTPIRVSRCREARASTAAILAGRTVNNSS